MNTELDDIRQKLDDIDEQIVKLLHHRADLSIAAGKAKAGKEAVYQPLREKALLKKITAVSGSLPQQSLLKIYGEILHASKELQQ